MTRKISEPKFNVSKLRISEYTGDGTHSLHSKNFGGRFHYQRAGTEFKV